MGIFIWATEVLLVALVIFFSAMTLIESARWAYRWCFNRLDLYFRDRYMKIMKENLARLDRILEDPL